jgi:catechol 2,3-dioxygenase-like lactoylglutathione lyase family enzyme
MNTYGLSHIQLTVRDVNKSRRFYSELFKMDIVNSDDDFAILRSPGTKEIITLYSNPKRLDQAGKMGGIRHFGFRLREPHNIEAIVKQVADLGGSPGQHGLRGENNEEPYAIFNDPDGYEVEIFFQPE